ncbi:glycosyltransferase [Sorangium sp. So ce1182]|uniref:glycosyltransferase n=1 Tax=Sorangium sp. So ce1182 TaxID=3133334 RepID=UPI003F638A4F
MMKPIESRNGSPDSPDLPDAPAASGGAPGPFTFLMTTPAETGHLLRILELARGLTARGHRVLVHTQASAEAAVRAAGAELVPYARHHNIVMRLRDRPVEGALRWVPAIPRNLIRFREALIESSVELAEELTPILRREHVDCLVHDTFGFGAGYAAERAGIPWASAGNAATVIDAAGLPLLARSLPLPRPIIERPALLHALADRLLPLGRARAALGLPPRRPGGLAEFVRAATSPELHVVMAHRGFLPDVALRERQLFAGPVSFNMPGGHGPQASRPAAPVEVQPGTVLVSTTTTGKDGGLLRRVLLAVAPMGIPILATAASAEDVPTGLGAHVRIERYLPHEEVFPKVAAVITHGGWGTIGRALEHGVPMLIIPLFGDQHINAAQAERGGFAHRLPLAEATPEAIRGRLRALLADGALRERAQAAAGEIRQLKSGAVAAGALERLAARSPHRERARYAPGPPAAQALEQG